MSGTTDKGIYLNLPEENASIWEGFIVRLLQSGFSVEIRNPETESPWRNSKDNRGEDNGN